MLWGKQTYEKLTKKMHCDAFTTITVYNERLTYRGGLIGWLILVNRELRESYEFVNSGFKISVQNLYEKPTKS